MAKDVIEFNFDPKSLVKGESKVADAVLLKYDDSSVFFPESCGITEKEFAAVTKHSREFLNAASKFAKEESAKVFRDDSSVKRVNFDLPYGTSANSGVEISVIREKRYPGNAMTGGKDTVKSVIQVSVVEAGYKPTQSLLSSLADQLTEEFVK